MTVLAGPSSSIVISFLDDLALISTTFHCLDSLLTLTYIEAEANRKFLVEFGRCPNKTNSRKGGEVDVEVDVEVEMEAVENLMQHRKETQAPYQIQKIWSGDIF